MKYVICVSPHTRPLEEGSNSSVKVPVPLVIQSLDNADDPEEYGCFIHFHRRVHPYSLKRSVPVPRPKVYPVG